MLIYTQVCSSTLEVWQRLEASPHLVTLECQDQADLHMCAQCKVCGVDVCVQVLVLRA